MSTCRTQIVLTMGFLTICIGALFVHSQSGWQNQASLPEDDVPSATKAPRDDLDLRLAAAHRPSEARKRIARQVLAGKLSLLQAAVRYQDLNESYDDFCWEDFRTRYPGATDDEHACRQVIEFVKIELSDHPQLSGLTVTKLEQELESLLRDGKVHLPR
jgi:hypothetical protein